MANYDYDGLEKMSKRNRKSEKKVKKKPPKKFKAEFDEFGPSGFKKDKGKKQKYQKPNKKNRYTKSNKRTDRFEDYNDENHTDDDESHRRHRKPQQHRSGHDKQQPEAAPGPMRLNRYIANAGICSRREADELIKKGKVTLNGQVVTEMGLQVERNDKVEVDGKLITPEKKVYILLNKPKDTVTTTSDPKARHTVMDLIGDACPERVYPVGRLDRNTTGVLLLTNDGEITKKLTHPKYNKKKIYSVELDKPLLLKDFQQIADGIELDDGSIKVDEISYTQSEDKRYVGIEIHSGRNRIVRRIFEHLGYRIEKLDRVFFAGLTKKGLLRGKWRFLSQKEVNFLKMNN